MQWTIVCQIFFIYLKASSNVSKYEWSFKGTKTWIKAKQTQELVKDRDIDHWKTDNKLL